MHRRTLLALLSAALLPAVASSGGAVTPARAAEPLRVVATIPVLGDMVHEIGGAHVAVTTLVPPDGDPHTYQPRPSDLVALRGAALVVVNGLGLEGWMARLVQAAGGHAVRVVAAASVKARRMQEGGHEVPDPHAWQDPRNGVLYVRTIAAALEQADPANAAAYAAAAKDYIGRIEATDAWIASAFATVPKGQRRIITSHDAFGYYAAHYGVDFIGVEGLSTEAEPTPSDIARLVRQIKREKVAAVFVENMTDPRIAETVARESGVVVGGTVYSDALSPPDGPAATYLQMLHYNTAEFVKALGGKAPGG